MKIQMALLGFALLVSPTYQACTPQAKTAADTAVQVAVDTCQEASVIFPNPVVELVCAVVSGGAPVAHIIIDSSVWNQMKMEYMVQHGRLPEGMSAPKYP